MSCGVGHRCGSDLVLLWLWCKLAASALIRPLAWGTSICHRCGPKNKQTNKQKTYNFICQLNLIKAEKNFFSLKVGSVSHCMAIESDDQRGEVTCPRSHSESMKEQRTASRFPGCLASISICPDCTSYTIPHPPLLLFSGQVFWSPREQWRLNSGRKIW